METKLERRMDVSQTFDWVRPFDVCENTPWHKDFSRYPYKEQELSTVFSKTVNNLKEAKALAPKATQDFELPERTLFLGRADNVLHVDLYRTWVFICPKGHLLLWGDDGNSYGRVVGYGGYTWFNEPG